MRSPPAKRTGTVSARRCRCFHLGASHWDTKSLHPCIGCCRNHRRRMASTPTCPGSRSTPCHRMSIRCTRHQPQGRTTRQRIRWWDMSRSRLGHRDRPTCRSTRKRTRCSRCRNTPCPARRRCFRSSVLSRDIPKAMPNPHRVPCSSLRVPQQRGRAMASLASSLP